MSSTLSFEYHGEYVNLTGNPTWNHNMCVVRAQSVVCRRSAAVTTLCCSSDPFRSPLHHVEIQDARAMGQYKLSINLKCYLLPPFHIKCLKFVQVWIYLFLESV